MLERAGRGFLALRGEGQRQKAPRKKPTTTGGNWGGRFVLGSPGAGEQTYAPQTRGDGPPGPGTPPALTSFSMK